MLKKTVLKSVAKKRTLDKNIDFFDLPEQERKRIVRDAVRLSMDDQQDLLDRYERKFGHLKTNTCD